MRYPYSPRTWPWPMPRDRGRSHAGSATLMALFLFFIFSVLGLSLVYIMQISLRVSAAKKKSVVLGYAAEIGLKQGWDHLAGVIAGRGFPRVISEDRAAELRSTIDAGGAEIVEEALGTGPPLSWNGRWEDQAWKARIDFSLERVRDESSFFVAAFKGLSLAEGTIPETRGRHSASSESSLEIAVGRVPLSFFPLLVNQPPNGEDAQAYARKHCITFGPANRGFVVPELSFAEPGLLPQDACPALRDALQVKIFKPQDLTIRALRQALRLEPSQDPVPAGVYLVRTDLGLGGVYVQGDLDELVLAIDQDSQVLFFRSPAGIWTLRFRLQPPRTSFATPSESVEYDLLPAGTVVVNGKIRSLGGGRPDALGAYVMSPDEEIPCLLHGVSLTIVSSDTMTLTSHLIREGVSWRDGIPYLKDADSKLTLYSTGVDFLTGDPTEGGVVIGQEAPRDLKVEASLVAPGRGFIVEGDDKVVRIAGSLQASAIEDGASAVALTPDQGTRFKEKLAPASPETSLPVFMVKGLRLRSWRDIP